MSTFLLFCQRVQLHFLITRRGKRKRRNGATERANVRRTASFVLGEAFCARPRDIRTYVAKHTQSVPNYYTYTYKRSELAVLRALKKNEQWMREGCRKMKTRSNRFLSLGAPRVCIRAALAEFPREKALCLSLAHSLARSPVLGIISRRRFCQQHPCITIMISIYVYLLDATHFMPLR